MHSVYLFLTNHVVNIGVLFCMMISAVCICCAEDMDMMKLVFLTAFVLLGLFFISSQALKCYKCDDTKDCTEPTPETCTSDDEKASCWKNKWFSTNDRELIFSFCHSRF